MIDLIKGELDWHETINSNFHEINSDKTGILTTLDEHTTQLNAMAIIPVKLEGEINDSPSIKRVLDTIKNTGGTIYFPKSEYIINEPILIYSNVKYIGCTKMGTKIKLADGANCDIFKTYNFENFSIIHNNGEYPTNYYDILPHSFEIRNLLLDGNYIAFENNTMIEDSENIGYYKHNNTLGFGIKIYARNYIIDNIRVTNVAQVGVYLECKDSEVSNINCETVLTGEEGFIYRGSHDSTLERINIGKTGYKVLKVDGTIDEGLNVSSVFSNEKIDGCRIEATCEVAELHSWGCLTNFGLFVNGDIRFKARQLIVEGSLNGFKLNTCMAQIELLDLHNNKKISLELNGDNGKQISNLNIYWTDEIDNISDDVIKITGNNNTIKGLIRVGDKCFGDALNITGYNNNIELTTRSFINSNVLKYNGGNNNRFRLIVENCKNVIALNGTPLNCVFDVNGSLNSGQTLLNIISGSVNQLNNVWSVSCYVNGVNKSSKERITSANSIALDSTTMQSINIPHNFFTIPNAFNISVQLNSIASIQDYEIAYIKVATITDTAITIQLKLATASTVSGAKGTLLLKID